MMLPDKRKPTAGKAAGFLNNIDALKIDMQEDSPNPRLLQVARLRNRWPGISMHLARAVAELAYGRVA